jgi:hypothetical protein
LAIFRTADMGSGSKPLTGVNAVVTDAITSLDSDGFTVGASIHSNTNGAVHSAICFGEDADVDVITYTGNGSTQDITSLSFQPTLVIAFNADAERAFFRSANHGSANSNAFNQSSVTDAITAILSNGFSLGANTGVNKNGVTHYALCIRNIADVFETFSYQGSGTDDYVVPSTPISFVPEAVWIKHRQSGTSMVGRFPYHVGDDSTIFTATVIGANAIQAINGDGTITVGTHDSVNHTSSARQFIGLAFRNPAGGVTIVDGAATLSGAGALSAQGLQEISAASAFSGSGALQAVAAVDVLGAATLSGQGDLDAAAELLVDGSVGMDGSGTLTAQGQLVVEGSALLQGTGSLTADALQEILAQAAFVGIGTLIATPESEGIVDGAVTMTGLGSLSAQGQTIVLAGATLVGNGELVADGSPIIEAGALLQGNGTLNADGLVEILASGAFAGTGLLDVAAVVDVFAEATFVGLGVLTADGEVPTLVPIYIVPSRTQGSQRVGGNSRSRAIDNGRATSIGDSDRRSYSRSS